MPGRFLGTERRDARSCAAARATAVVITSGLADARLSYKVARDKRAGSALRVRISIPFAERR